MNPTSWIWIFPSYQVLCCIKQNIVSVLQIPWDSINLPKYYSIIQSYSSDKHIHFYKSYTSKCESIRFKLAWENKGSRGRSKPRRWLSICNAIFSCRFHVLHGLVARVTTRSLSYIPFTQTNRFLVFSGAIYPLIFLESWRTKAQGRKIKSQHAFPVQKKV